MEYWQASKPKGGSCHQDTYINDRKNNRSGEVEAHGIKPTDSLLSKNKKHFDIQRAYWLLCEIQQL